MAIIITTAGDPSVSFVFGKNDAPTPSESRVMVCCGKTNFLRCTVVDSVSASADIEYLINPPSSNQRICVVDPDLERVGVATTVCPIIFGASDDPPSPAALDWPIAESQMIPPTTGTYREGMYRGRRWWLPAGMGLAIRKVNAAGGGANATWNFVFSCVWFVVST